MFQQQHYITYMFNVNVYCKILIRLKQHKCKIYSTVFQYILLKPQLKFPYLGKLKTEWNASSTHIHINAGTVIASIGTGLHNVHKSVHG